MVVTFAALHWLSTSTLGEFTLVYVCITLALVVIRSMSSEPLVLLVGQLPKSVNGRELSGSAGFSLMAGVPLSVALLVAHTFVTAPFDDLFIAAAFALPLVFTQDAIRYWSISQQRYWQCAVIDGSALVATAITVVVCSLLDALNPGLLIAAWAVGAFVGGLVGALIHRTIPSGVRGVAWLKSQWRTGAYLAGSTAAQQSSGRLSLMLVRGISGAEALGTLSASRAALLPLNSFVTAVSSFALPEAVHRRRIGLHELDKFVRVMCLFCAGLLILAVVCVWSLPESLGRLIAGDNWAVAHSLIVPTGLWIVGIGVSQGYRAGIRALGGARLMFKISMVLGLVMLVCATVGAIAADGVGAAWGFGLASLAGLLYWHVGYRNLRYAVV